MKYYITAILLALFLSGCSLTQSHSGTFAVQYATLKLIEQSDTIEAHDVLSATYKVREIIERDENLSTASLSSSFREKVDISSLDAADQLLVRAVISRIEDTINSEVSTPESFLSFDQKISLIELLDRVDEAANLLVE